MRKLEGGDRRSIGRSNEVVAEVLAERRLFSALFAGLSVDDPIVRGRSKGSDPFVSFDRALFRLPHVPSAICYQLLIPASRPLSLAFFEPGTVGVSVGFYGGGMTAGLSDSGL